MVALLTERETVILKKSQKLNNWNSTQMHYAFQKNHQRKWTVKRGEVYFVDLGENIGSEENKTRPCVVLQANAYNFESPVFTCAIISSSAITVADIQIPITGQYFYKDNKNISKQLTGAVDLGQIKTVAKERIVSKVCMLSQEMREIDNKLFNALGL